MKRRENRRRWRGRRGITIIKGSKTLVIPIFGVYRLFSPGRIARRAGRSILYCKVRREPVQGSVQEKKKFSLYFVHFSTTVRASDGANYTRLVTTMMGDGPGAQCSLSQPVSVTRPRRSRKIAQHDVDNVDIEEFAQQEMTKASYSSYFGPFLAYAVKQGWTSKFYSQFFSSGPSTPEFVQQHKIRPICSTANVEKYLRDEFSKNGRRRGIGLVSRAMADQFMKSVCNQRNKEFSSNLPALQEDGWIVQNLEFAARGDNVLRAQPIMNIVEAIARRDVQDKTARCVEKKFSKQRLTGEEIFKICSWAWGGGDPQQVRILTSQTLGRAMGLRSDNLERLCLRNLETTTVGSIAAGLAEYPALGVRPGDSKENHDGKMETTGCMIHTDPRIDPVAAVGMMLVSQYVVWGRIPPDFTSRENWWSTYLFCTFPGRNGRNPICKATMSADIKRAFVEGLHWTEQEFETIMKNVATRIWRKTNAAETSFACVPEGEADRIGLWASSRCSRRVTNYLSTEVPFAAARALAGTVGDIQRPHVTDWIPHFSVTCPPLESRPLEDHSVR